METAAEDKNGQLKNSTKGHRVFGNALKSKAPENALPARKVKRPGRGEATYLTYQLERPKLERLSLSSEVKKQNNHAVIKDKMAKMFHCEDKELGAERNGLHCSQWMRQFTFVINGNNGANGGGPRLGHSVHQEASWILG